MGALEVRVGPLHFRRGLHHVDGIARPELGDGCPASSGFRFVSHRYIASGTLLWIVHFFPFGPFVFFGLFELPTSGAA